LQEHVHPANNGMEVTELRVFIYTHLRKESQGLRIIDKFKMCTLLARGHLACAGLGQLGRRFIFTEDYCALCFRKYADDKRKE
jgi:hypothetical protein